MFGNKKQKELNEWNYVEEKKKEKEEEEEYVVSSEKKFRARALIITAVLCIAIIALGVVYMNKIIETTNAETVDNSQIIETSSTEASSDNPKANVGASAALTSTTAQSTTGSESTTTSAATSQEETADTTTAAAEVVDEFTATASADENGLVVEWKYTNSGFAGKMLSIYMTDGMTSYMPVGEHIPIDANKFTTSVNDAKNAVGLYIIIMDTNDNVLFEKSITVNNTTYVPEVTYSDDIDISGLFN